MCMEKIEQEEVKLLSGSIKEDFGVISEIFKKQTNADCAEPALADLS